MGILTSASKAVQQDPVHPQHCFWSHSVAEGRSQQHILQGTGKPLSVMEIPPDSSCLCRRKKVPVIKVSP